MTPKKERTPMERKHIKILIPGWGDIFLVGIVVFFLYGFYRMAYCSYSVYSRCMIDGGADQYGVEGPTGYLMQHEDNIAWCKSEKEAQFIADALGAYKQVRRRDCHWSEDPFDGQ
jgi:hypothetical protein